MSASTSSISTKPGRRLQRLGPWTISLAVHAGLIAIGFALTWSIIRLDERLPSPIVTSSDIVLTPVMPLHSGAAAESSSPATSIPVPTLLSKSTDTPRLDGPAPAAASSVSTPTVFAGASMQQAREVVFVIDVSGSMIAWIQFVIDEVERTLGSMSSDQQFAVICFAGEDVRVMPRDGLVFANPATVTSLVHELRTTASQRFGVGSDPVPGLQAAVAMKPELIMLLSEGLDGRGRWAVDRDATLTALDAMNPRRGSGNRPFRISCIRLVTDNSPDEAVLMGEIASQHGDGHVHRVTLEELDR